MQAPPPLAPAAPGSAPSQASLNKSTGPQRIYVAGHKGMVGSAICRALTNANQNSNAPVTLITRDRQSLDLTNQAAVNQFFASEKPDQVYLAAAKVGGIQLIKPTSAMSYTLTLGNVELPSV